MRNRTIHIMMAAALALGFLASAPVHGGQRMQALVMATGATSSTGYILGGSIADLLTRKMENTVVTIQATGGSIENVRLVRDGQVEIGHSTEVYNSWNGLGGFKTEGPIHDIVPMMQYGAWASHIIVNHNSPVQKIEDLKGLRVGLGAAGSGNAINSEAILKAHGMTFADIRPEYLSYTEQIDALKDGNIDVAMIMTVAPGSTIVQMATQDKIRLISIAPEMVKKIVADNAIYTPVTLPAGTYQGVDVETTTVNSPGWFVVRSDMDEELVYQIVKIIADSLDELRAINAEFRVLRLEMMPETLGIPLHPGAARFFKEIGLL